MQDTNANRALCETNENRALQDTNVNRALQDTIPVVPEIFLCKFFDENLGASTV